MARSHSLPTLLTWLVLGFASVAAATVCLLLVSSQRERGKQEVSVQTLISTYERFSAIRNRVGEGRELVQSLVRSRDPDEIERLLARSKAADEALAGELAPLGEAVQGSWRGLSAIEAKAVESILLGDTGRAAELLIQEVAPARVALDRQLGAALKAQESALTEARTVSQRAQHGFNVAIGAVSIAVVLGLAVFGLLLRVRIARRLAAAAGALGQVSRKLEGALGELGGTSRLLAQGASQQASSLEETSATLEEISGMTRRNAENAGNARAIVRETRAAAESGFNDMRAMSAAVAAIKTSSDQIASIIKTIDEIAFQTNILALNAAVEAARAGAAGAGFAVVAEEVRALAQRSAVAARETAAKIEDAVHRTGEGVRISDKVGRALDDIVSRVRRTDELINEIATASSEQNTGLAQLNSAVASMDKVTQANAASAEETSASVQELNREARELVDAMSSLNELAGRSITSAETTSASAADGGQQARAEQTEPTPIHRH